MPSLHPRSTRPVSAHASWPCWPRTASPAPSCAFASSVCLQSPPGWFVQGCQKICGSRAQTASVHDSRIYNGEVSFPRGTRNPRPPLFTILAQLTCFLLVFRLGLCLSSYLFILTSPRTSTLNDPHLTSAPCRHRTWRRELSGSSFKTHRRKGAYHTLSQDVWTIEKGERLTDHHQIKASVNGRDPGLGCLQAPTLHCFTTPTIQRLLRPKPGGSLWKVGTRL